MRCLPVALAIVPLVFCAALASSDARNPQSALEKPKVEKEQVRGGIVFPAERRMWLRITGKVTVLDASTLAFADGTEVAVAGGIDAPDLQQKGLIGEKFYPCGKEAADFLKKLIGDKTVTFLGDRQEPKGKRLRGSCYVGETSLGIEMLRNG